MEFKIGKSYYTRSICDSEMIIKITVASRTAKFITTSEGQRLKVNAFNGNEYVMPWGKYSMSPTISADKEC